MMLGKVPQCSQSSLMSPYLSTISQIYFKCQQRFSPVPQHHSFFREGWGVCSPFVAYCLSRLQLVY